MKISARKKCCRTLEQLQMRELCVSHAFSTRSARPASQVLHIAAFERFIKFVVRVCLCSCNAQYKQTTAGIIRGYHVQRIRNRGFYPSCGR